MVALLVLCLVAGIVFSLFSIDDTIKKIVYVVLAVFALVVVLQFLGVDLGAQLHGFRN
jgi:hypothetical protein